MLLAAIRSGANSGAVNSLMAKILEDHIRLRALYPDRATESAEELSEDLIGLAGAYLR